jgi:hypothetical protein
MQAVTDPTTDIQAVRGQLDLIKKLYGVDRVGQNQRPIGNLQPRIENVPNVPNGWTPELEDEYQKLYGGGR